MNIGDNILYVDQYGKVHNALITTIHGSVDEENAVYPAINLIHVVPSDENKKDSWGNQVARDSSVVPWSVQSAHGRYYIPFKDGKLVAEFSKYTPGRWLVETK